MLIRVCVMFMRESSLRHFANVPGITNLRRSCSLLKFLVLRVLLRVFRCSLHSGE
jgi:hypothetical protein